MHSLSREMELSFEKDISIGRSDECDIVINDISFDLLKTVIIILLYKNQ